MSAKVIGGKFNCDRSQYSVKNGDGRYKGEHLIKFFKEYPDFVLHSFKDVKKPEMYYVEYSIINLKINEEINGNEFIKEITDKFKDKTFRLSLRDFYDEYYRYIGHIELRSEKIINNENYVEENKEYHKKKKKYYNEEQLYFKAVRLDVEENKKKRTEYILSKRNEEKKEESDKDKILRAKLSLIEPNYREKDFIAFKLFMNNIMNKKENT